MLGRIKTRIRRGASSGGASSGGEDNGGMYPSSSASSTAMLMRPSATPPSSAFMERDKVEELASFDACVEACDALAAASSYARSSAKRDKATGLRDCSVLVSPDGDLLLVPQDAQQQQQGATRTSHMDERNEEEEEAKPAGDDAEAVVATPDENTAAPQDDPDLVAESDGAPIIAEEGAKEKNPDTPFASADFAVGMTGDYESAVVVGNDLCPDKSMNGFSAMGWSPAATSVAVRQTEQSLRTMATFVESIILSRKEAAARASDACDLLRGMGHHHHVVPSLPVPQAMRLSRGRSNRRHSSHQEDYDIISALDAMPMEGGVELSQNRVGPLAYSGGSLHAATAAMEQYHSIMAENDSNRLRMASKSVNSKVGVLPALQQEAEQTTRRAYNREKALREMQQRADAMENRLERCKAEAKRRWDAVHNAEEAVTGIVEELMMERSRERERRRFEQLREEEEKRADQNGDMGATANEIWDIVSKVAESMEDGSFAPTGLPDAPLSGPRDKGTQEDLPEPDASPDPLSSPAPLPLASRTEIEHECNLPELRAAAMAADEAIEDTAGSLLNILSTLDTTRRSARIAAETCLLSACHAQAACLRSMVALERAAIEDRLENIKELERVMGSINVRSDLDLYITKDKQERGGSTRLGEDDDGGVASALAVLSSHVDGNMGLGSPSKIFTDGWNESEAEEITPEQLEDSVEALFESNEHLLDEAEDSGEGKKAKEEYTSTVDFLCKIAADKSPASRSRRSTICYALNSKRSSDAEIASQIQFDGICQVFLAILDGCDREFGGVSNAKMCMMLSQTFYLKNGGDSDDNQLGSPARVERSKRLFVKDKLIDHPVWSDEEFWDQALFQCVSESLTHSGVMANFDRKSSNSNQSEWTESKKIKWHDLTQNERAEAASQVHAVVFAQLGALAHSMVEFGCSLESSCSFVRRMAIRNQLPISQRTMLLKHLMGREEKDKK